MLTGENLMLSTYTARGAGEIAFASSFPGSIIAKELGAGEVFLAQKSAFLCATYGVEMSVEVNKSASSGLIGGEGLFDTVLTGPGHVYLQTMTVPRIAQLISTYLPKKN